MDSKDCCAFLRMCETFVKPGTLLCGAVDFVSADSYNRKSMEIQFF